MNATPLIIRDLDPAVDERFRVRAAEHGRYMQDEVASILKTVLNADEELTKYHFFERIRARFEPLDGVDLELPPRAPLREPPRFD